RGVPPDRRQRRRAAVPRAGRFSDGTLGRPNLAASPGAGGSRSVATKEEPTAPGMPSFAWQLNDAQIAAVATYVRNHWGNPAPAISQSEVAKQRSSLAKRSD